MKTLIVICALALAVGACDKSHPTSTTANNSAAAPLGSASESSAVEPAIPGPTHNYALEQDGEYGYQAGISEEEAKQGTVTKPLTMYRYRGKIEGAYTVEMTDDSITYRASCQDPCKFIKVRAIVNGRTIKTATMPNTDGSVISAVFEDAMSGQLQPYQQP